MPIPARCPGEAKLAGIVSARYHRSQLIELRNCGLDDGEVAPSNPSNRETATMVGVTERS